MSEDKDKSEELGMDDLEEVSGGKSKFKFHEIKFPKTTTLIGYGVPPAYHPLECKPKRKTHEIKNGGKEKTKE